MKNVSRRELSGLYGVELGLSGLVQIEPIIYKHAKCFSQSIRIYIIFKHKITEYELRIKLYLLYISTQSVLVNQ